MKFIRKKNTREKELKAVVLPEQQIMDYLMEKAPQEYKRNEDFKVYVKEDIDFKYFVEMHIHLDTNDIEIIKKESKYLASIFLFPPYPIILFRFVYHKNGNELCFVTKTDAGEYYVTIGEESIRFK